MVITKDKLVGKNIEFYDCNGAQRIGKVLRVKKGSILVGKGKHRVRMSGIVVSVKYGFTRSKKRSRRQRATENILSDKVLYWIHHGHVKEDIIWDDKKKAKEEPEKRQRKARKPREAQKIEAVEPVGPGPEQGPRETRQVTLFDAVGNGVKI